MIRMEVLARIEVTPLMMMCDEVSGLRFQIVAPEFASFDGSVVYCGSIDEVLALLRELKQMRAVAIETPPLVSEVPERTRHHRQCEIYAGRECSCAGLGVA